MKINILFVLFLIVACQSQDTQEQAPTILEATEQVDNIPNDKDQSESQEIPPINGVNMNLPSWDLVKSAFPKMDPFPVECTVFPLQAITIGNDTLKMDGEVCYYFPLEVATDFIQKHVGPSDILTTWLKENSNSIGQGTDFEHGIYPFGRFEYAAKDYYIYYTLDDVTGRGSYTLSFYLATAFNQRWESKLLGEQYYSKYNIYENIEGEEFLKDRMASEQNLILELQKNKLVIAHYSGEHVVGDDFDVFNDGEISSITELILDQTDNTRADYTLSCEKEENKEYCSYGNYRTVVTFYEDEKGRGNSFSVLEKRVGAEYKEIKVSNLLMKNNDQLLSKINQEVTTIYKKLISEYSEDDECIKEITFKESYGVDDFSIAFYEEGIFFEVDFDLSSACFALDGNGFIIKWEEIKQFIQ